MINFCICGESSKYKDMFNMVVWVFYLYEDVEYEIKNH